MQDGTIGRRYARALALSLGEGASAEAFQRAEQELSALAELFADKASDLRQAMLNPVFPMTARLDILASIGEAHDFSESTRNMLRLLVEKKRIGHLPSIAAAFKDQVDERTGQVRAYITSARVLEERQLQELVAALERRTGKRVVPQLEVEPEVIAGVSARIGGMVFDNTVRTRLERMKSALSAT
jgi:F-type H+-transporting ATPase subunit delta